MSTHHARGRTHSRLWLAASGSLLGLIGLGVGGGEARAAELRLGDGVLTYVAAPGSTQQLEMRQTAPDVVRVVRRPDWGDDDPIVVGGGSCSPVTAEELTCTGVHRVEASLGDGEDVISFHQLTSTAHVWTEERATTT